jgi:hypothetical protein
LTPKVTPTDLSASEDGGVDLRPETMLDAHGVATVLRLLDDAPGPNEAMLRLFDDRSGQPSAAGER